MTNVSWRGEQITPRELLVYHNLLLSLFTLRTLKVVHVKPVIEPEAEPRNLRAKEKEWS